MAHKKKDQTKRGVLGRGVLGQSPRIPTRRSNGFGRPMDEDKASGNARKRGGLNKEQREAIRELIKTDEGLQRFLEIAVIGKTTETGEDATSTPERDEAMGELFRLAFSGEGEVPANFEEMKAEMWENIMGRIRAEESRSKKGE